MSETRWPQTDVLEQLVSPRRQARIDGVLERRIVSVTVVFEDLFDPHNVAAGIRTCDAFGLADVHVITNQNEYGVRADVAASADQWMTIHAYTSTEACVAALKAAGFSIWVSDLQADHALAEVPPTDKIALVVGAEKDGITAEMRALADVRYILPMHGMVQSLNVSVALAVSLQTIMPQVRAALGGRGNMPVERQWELRKRWLEYGIRNPELVRRGYENAENAGEKR